MTSNLWHAATSPDTDSLSSPSIFQHKLLQSTPKALLFYLGRLLWNSLPHSCWYQRLIPYYSQQWSVFLIHGQIHCRPDVWTNDSHKPFPIAAQWDTLGQAFTQETLRMVLNIWSKLLLISNTNDLICFCFKYVQLTTFRISSFYPEIIIGTY